MKNIIFYILLLTSVSAFAQNDTLSVTNLENELSVIKSSIIDIQKTNIALNTDLLILNSKLKAAFDSIKILNMQLQNNSKVLAEKADNLDLKISATDETAKKRIDEVDDSLSKKSMYGIIGVLMAVLLSVVLYWFLRRRQKFEKTDIIEQLNKTRSSIEENLVKELANQTELLDNQWSGIEEQIKNQPVIAPVQDVDHSLPLKLADEITVIERNISFMDKNVKGIKQLLRSLQKLKDNLSANGYEIPELLGKDFNQGMRLIVVTSVPDENLKEGEEKITKIIKPQVNYGGKMIQAAQVEVSIG